jgi:Fe-Mn family superoxide dismutase
MFPKHYLRSTTVALLSSAPYKAKQFDLSGLNGISDKTLEMHFTLYAGYVTNTNKITEQLEEIVKGGQAAGTNLAYAELTRRLGFEYSGMILHEYYFGNMKKQASAQPSGDLKSALEGNFGSVDNFLADFKAVGGLRGVGWAVLFHDPAANKLSTQWITLHQDGNPAGFKPLLVLDVWEHAFLLDYKPSERAKYIDSFLSNVDWDVVAARYKAAGAERPIG